jgi:hypothetical protein
MQSASQETDLNADIHEAASDRSTVHNAFSALHETVPMQALWSDLSHQEFGPRTSLFFHDWEEERRSRPADVAPGQPLSREAGDLT